MDAVRKLIFEKLEERGLKMSEASLRIGRNHAYLQQFLKRGIPMELGEHERAKLSDLLGVPETDLRGTSAPLPRREYIRQNGTANNPQPHVKMSDTAHNRIDNGQQVAAVFGDADLPVYGTAQGGTGALILSSQAVDYVARPAPLLKVQGAYGLIVTGDSMSPKVEHGDTVLVNPHLPPRGGDTCVFQRHQDDGAALAIVKRLRRFTDETWFVSQYHPAKDFQLKRSEWQLCHVTVGSYYSR